MKRSAMPWIIIILGYLLGALPTAFLAGHFLRGVNIRRVGDENMGAANAYHQLGPAVGVAIGVIDGAKGALAVLLAQSAGLSQLAVLSTGVAAVAGHNWPVFIGFRGGRGASTTIGILLVTSTGPILILAIPTLSVLIIKKNTTAALAFLFISLPFVSWLLHIPGLLIAYGIALPCLVGFTHYLRVRGRVVTQA
ncbi:MAG: glycerol-3-phosphate acyltransferase [Chloroflexota bacterium]